MRRRTHLFIFSALSDNIFFKKAFGSRLLSIHADLQVFCIVCLISGCNGRLFADDHRLW